MKKSSNGEFLCFNTHNCTLESKDVQVHSFGNNRDMVLMCTSSYPRRCAGGRIGTRFLRPSPLKGVNPAGTPGYRNGTELLRLEGASVGCAGCINSQPTRPLNET